MPRNPRKTRCQVPGCKAWAMRGHTLCRVHRDPELDPRGAGAPPGNLNALRHGAHSHPLSAAELSDLAQRIVEAEDDLPYQVGMVVQSIQARVGDPLLALMALRRVLPALIAGVAALIFDAELRAYLAPLAPQVRACLREIIERNLPGGPEQRLQFLRQLIRERSSALQADR
jgi:hypothetical protein